MSEISIGFHVEAQRAQNPSRWDGVGIHSTEQLAREDMEDYKSYASTGKSGWLGFRVVRVTTTREILP